MFNAAHNDLFNLAPAVGEVNGQRKDYNWGMIPGEKREFGACNFASGWTCGVKTTCGQMGSCDEAKFYLTQCSVKRLDGDGDGVPCASLCHR